MQIATGTGPSEIVEFGWSTKTARDDMLDVKRGPLQRLMHPTVFASSAGALLHRAVPSHSTSSFGLTPQQVNRLSTYQRKPLTEFNK